MNQKLSTQKNKKKQQKALNLISDNEKKSRKESAGEKKETHNDENITNSFKKILNSKKSWKIVLVFLIFFGFILLVWSVFFRKTGTGVSSHTFESYIDDVYTQNFIKNYNPKSKYQHSYFKDDKEKNKDFNLSNIVFANDSNNNFTVTINDLVDKKAKITKPTTVFTHVNYTNGEEWSSTLPIKPPVPVNPKSPWVYKTEMGHWGYYIRDEKQNSFVSIQGVSNTGFIIQIILSLLPIIIIIVIFYFAYRMLMKNKGMMGGMGLPFRKTVQKPTTSTTRFADVAGYTEEKDELLEIFDILKHPDRYHSSGARIPKGVLLVGEPGTGKTLLAKAVAGESHVPFFYISGSEFVELFIGMGAQRVRGLFTTAKKHQPCIIFIDELDTIGRQRGANVGNTNDEREQTLNQLLVEMDGFNSSKSTIILIGATNRFDTLDKALLRPGRFDRIIRFHNPTKIERLAILKKHVENKNIHPQIDLNEVSKKTPGFTGAQLENVINEATLLSIRNKQKAILLADIDEAIDRVIGGLAKKTKKYVKKEKLIVSYHESGHALAGLVLEGCDEVQKITIIPRGDAGGYTLSIPKEERFFTSKKEIIEKIIGLLAGRAAEEYMFGSNEITTGAHNDIKQATSLVRSMVLELGMTSLGNVKFDLNMNNNNPYLFSKGIGLSEKLKAQIDDKIQKIMAKGYEKALFLINENKSLLHLLASALVKREVLNREEISYIYKNGKHPEGWAASDDKENIFTDLFAKKQPKSDRKTN